MEWEFFSILFVLLNLDVLRTNRIFNSTIVALDLKTPAVYEGSPKSGKADTTLVISDDDMVDLSTGKLNPQVAFMKGKLKITGNIMLTQKLVPLLKAEPKL